MMHAYLHSLVTHMAFVYNQQTREVKLKAQV